MLPHIELYDPLSHTPVSITSPGSATSTINSNIQKGNFEFS